MREPAQSRLAPAAIVRRERAGGKMDAEASRIPVYAAFHRGPAEAQAPFSTKKQCGGKAAAAAGLELHKDPDFNFGSSAPADGVFRATNAGIPKSAKKAEPPLKKAATRGPLSRYKLEAELKTKNQLLESAKQQLHSKLTGAQGTIKDLKEENEGLLQEVERLKKFQETCMVILESKNIDPGKGWSHLRSSPPDVVSRKSVTGNNILEEEEKAKECREQAALLTEKLVAGLKQFNETAEKEKEALQAAMARWRSAAEERQRSLEQHSSFQEELKGCSAVLEQLEQLLAQ
ncbi:hypothetical protein ASZ78_011717 [Callipepla squamata]|uniref:SKAP protein n=1 Tax=Callipepla squamata TaxID=9009 RepID=A0A226MLH1_CALSU|nr:hypothetical protein ASZ78_011717 [Callipepla squamata]